MTDVYCPQCGEKMIWDCDYNRNEVEDDLPEEDSSIMTCYHCMNCGSSVDFYECSDEEKREYPYWSVNTSEREDGEDKTSGPD